MQRPSPTKVILDTDPGVDDALALLLAFASPELQVVGVTTVCGNVPVGQATKNLFRLLNVVQPPPGLLVGQGAARPLEEDLVTAVQVHGSDGLGELDSEISARDEEIMITKNGKPAAVIISSDEFDSWKETVAIRNDKELMKEIRSGLKSKKKVINIDELFEDSEY